MHLGWELGIIALLSFLDANQESISFASRSWIPAYAGMTGKVWMTRVVLDFARTI